MPKDINGGLPYFYKKAQTVLTAYELDVDDDGSYSAKYVANNEDISPYTALAIKRGTITSEDGTVLNELEVGLDNVDLAFKQWVLHGNLERKKMKVKLLFVSPAKTILQQILLYQGALDAPKGDEKWLTLTVRPFDMFEREYPRRIYQVGCNWRLADNQCSNSGGLGAYDYVGDLTALSDGVTLTMSHGQAANYFIPGYVYIMEGDYEGEARPILANDTSSVTVRVGFGHTIDNGTEVLVQKLCAKNPDACQNIFNNYENYGGFPHVPKQPII